jgi:hypothetical protein
VVRGSWFVVRRSSFVVRRSSFEVAARRYRFGNWRLEVGSSQLRITEMQQSATEQRTLNDHHPPSTIHGPSVYGDIVGGITTFFTMAYIVVVNPGILASQGTGMAFSGVLTATVVLSFAMTLMMGLYARLPFAVAPGMGPQRVLRIHDRVAAAGPVASGAWDRLLGGSALPHRFRDATA